MQKEAMIKKLAAVKALAENGVGGEKETARRMYEDLKAKYGITDGEVAAVKEPAAAEVKKEFSDIAFALWVLANNLDDEMKICRDCPDRNNPDAICAGCAKVYAKSQKGVGRVLHLKNGYCKIFSKH